MVVPLLIAGVPLEIVALVPVPFVCAVPRLAAAQRCRLRLARRSGCTSRSGVRGGVRPHRPTRPGACSSASRCSRVGRSVAIAAVRRWALLPAMVGRLLCAVARAGSGCRASSSVGSPYAASRPGEARSSSRSARGIGRASPRASSCSARSSLDARPHCGGRWLASTDDIDAATMALWGGLVIGVVVLVASAIALGRGGVVGSPSRPERARRSPSRAASARRAACAAKLTDHEHPPRQPGSGRRHATLDRELEELIREEHLEPGDHERFSHYVKKDKILESAITGKPVQRAVRQEVDAGARPREVPGLPRPAKRSTSRCVG